MTDNSQIIALGLTGKQWIDLLHGDTQAKARQCLNYLDGDLETEVIKTLSDPAKGRRDWSSRGIIPRYRNITGMVIEKSGPLFNHRLPSFDLYTKNTNRYEEKATSDLYQILSSIPFQEFLINDDQVRRLIKSSVWLIQYDTTTQQLVLETLHRANCGVIVDSVRNISGLIYATSDSTYRIMTSDTIIDIMVELSTSKISITNTVENPYGIVPAGFMYDTKLPRSGVWPAIDSSLVSFNDAYNLHLTEAEFTMRWMMNPTMVMIDAGFDETSTNYTQEVLMYGEKLPTTVPSTETANGGPGVIIGINSNGNGAARIEYVGPQVAITPIDDVYNQWSQQIAQDYSVNLSMSGKGTAASGFQLIVEEIPNLELRKQRQRVFEHGMKRLWPLMRTVLNVSSPYHFSEDLELFVEFSDPKLPVNAMEQEEIWSKRISEGRATIVDYFVQEHGLSVNEATAKVREIARWSESTLT